jgi:hypothetical protein
MSFKYINPGYGELFEGKTGAYTASGTVYNPYNGVAILANGTPYISIPSLTHVYVKFGIISPNGSYYNRTNVMIDGMHGVYFDDTYGNIIQFYANKSAHQMTNAYAAESYSEVLIDVEVGANGHVYVYINGVLKYSMNGSVTNGSMSYAGCSQITFYSNSGFNGGKSYMSNILISDADISNEHVAIASPSITMPGEWASNSNGSYSVSTSGKPLLQKIDVDALDAAMAPVLGTGKTAAIQGVSMAAVPAYYDSGTPNAIQNIVSGTSVATPETKSLTTTTSAGMYTQALVVNPLTSLAWSEEDLRALSFGLQSAGA